jgi:hypothetical protein
LVSPGALKWGENPNPKGNDDQPGKKIFGTHNTIIIDYESAYRLPSCKKDFSPPPGLACIDDLGTYGVHNHPFLVIYLVSTPNNMG